MPRLRPFHALLIMAALSLAVPALAAIGTPIATDSRIKTFVYNPNEVFAITTHYGYQSNVEFGAHESIDTVSVGDRVGWQIIPAGQRLFIRPMEENAHTNMTIVTNKRAYQFDLRSSSADAVFGSEELTYVVRFYYPDDTNDGAPAPTNYSMPAPVSAPAATPAAYAVPAVAPPSMAAAPAYAPPPAAPAPAPGGIPIPGANYRYTYSGPNGIAPLKIFDDGRSTYFKLRPGNNPQIAVITASGDTLKVPTRRTPDGLLAVDIVAPRFSLRDGGQQVIVYNETAG